MRYLSERELSFVCGAEGQCTPENTSDQLPGLGSSSNFGDNVIRAYEGAVAAVSHIIERVAEALK
jgi:hypothetical protein